MNKTIYTIGYFNQTFEEFSSKLKTHNINVVCDVRSSPYSGYNPAFNEDRLKRELPKLNIKYVGMGRELGARSENSDHYIDGKVQYNLLEKSKLFQSGIDRLITGLGKNYNIVLMCSEKCPLTCHRTILVGRNLFKKENIQISHILADGSLETYQQATDRLIDKLNIRNDLFISSNEEKHDFAYKRQGENIAYQKK